MPLRLVSCLVLTLTLAACGIRQQDRQAPVEGPQIESEAQACFADLKAKSVKLTPLPDRDFGGGCQNVNTIQLTDFGTPTSNLGPMTCPLATNFVAWARNAVQPAARQYLGAELVRIETFGTYSCRNVGGGSSGNLSEHSLANAVDVSAFVLSDGRKVTVLDGWRGTAQEQQFLRRLHQSACRRFGTALGPDSDEAHANHFHFDMAQRRYGSFCQ